MKRLLFHSILVGALCLQAQASDAAYERLWNRAILFKGSENELFQEVRLIGREQLDFYAFKSNSSETLGLRNRRLRLGFNTRFLNDFTFTSEFDFNPGNPDPLFNKITDFSLKWAPRRSFKVTLGRQGSQFTLDGGTSSNNLQTIDRSVISNNIGLLDDSVPGISVEGDVGRLFYRAGVYSSGSATRTFGKFDAGTMGVWSTGWHVDKQLGLEKAFLRFDHMILGDDPQNGQGTPGAFTRNQRHASAVNLQAKNGPWGLLSELAASQGRGTQSDLRAFQFQPSYELSNSWQIVTRYTWVESSEKRGVALVRFENLVTAKTCDRYREIYLGLNRYFYGHRLKWLIGLERAEMQDRLLSRPTRVSWGITNGFRVSW
ncbi:MAG: porin [Verrucomicrobiota bacterium]